MLQYLPLPYPRIPQSHHAPYLPSEALWTSFYGKRAGHVSSACTVAIKMWLPFCPACLWQNGSCQTKCFTGLHSAAEDFDHCRKLLQHCPELAKAAKWSSLSLSHVAATQMRLPFCGRGKMAATFRITPCGYTKKQVIPALWKALELFKRKVKGKWGEECLAW